MPSTTESSPERTLVTTGPVRSRRPVPCICFRRAPDERSETITLGGACHDSEALEIADDRSHRFELARGHRLTVGSSGIVFLKSLNVQRLHGEALASVEKGQQHRTSGGAQ